MRVFDVLFKAVSTGFGLRTIEKNLENPHFIFCSVFQNLRLGTIKFNTFLLNHEGRIQKLHDLRPAGVNPSLQ